MRKPPGIALANNYLIHNPSQWNEGNWAKFFKEQSWYTGDPERSGQLMRQVVEGMQWVQDELLDRGITAFKMSELRLVKDYEQPGLQIARGHHTGGVPGIFIESGYLAEASHASVNQIIRDIYERTGQVLYEGTVDDLYFLVGLEETDHDRYEQQYGAPDAPYDAHQVPIELYDAQPHEFQAMEKKVIAGRARKMNDVTIAILEGRLRAAQALRQS